MAAGKSVESMLADAKNTLSHADNFTKAATGGSQSSFAPKHEYSNASYTLVKKPSSGMSAEADSAGKGLRARAEMEAKVKE